MSYQAQQQLTSDAGFVNRTVACCTQQASAFQNDQRPNYVALAEGIMRSDGNYVNTFINLNAAGPGIADKVDNGDGTIDSAKVTDADLLSLTQANWPTVADLYFNEDGSPK